MPSTRRATALGSAPPILIMDKMGTPGEGTRPTRGRFCGGCRPGALSRRGGLGHNENCWKRATFPKRAPWTGLPEKAAGLECNSYRGVSCGAPQPGPAIRFGPKPSAACECPACKQAIFCGCRPEALTRRRVAGGSCELMGRLSSEAWDRMPRSLQRMILRKRRPSRSPVMLASERGRGRFRRTRDGAASAKPAGGRSSEKKSAP